MLLPSINSNTQDMMSIQVDCLVDHQKNKKRVGRPVITVIMILQDDNNGLDDKNL